MQSTRWEILQLLKKRGRATVDELSRALGLTLMGVRLHLVVLDRDGYVRRSTVREKPGRPALVYSLTQKAEELFPKRYDLLAEKLLEALHLECDESFAAVLVRAARSMAAPLAGQMAGAPLAQRVEEIGRVLDGAGSFACWEKVEGGYLLHSHNCLFYSVAQRNREVCSIDEVFLGEILGGEVTRTECLLDGSLRCSFFVPETAQE
ncbi:MAG: helix-turn-helix transcriptional regulator [Sphingomonadaceae bacterium]